MEKILLLGGSFQQVIAIKTAKRMGLFTILCDYLPDNPGQYYADLFYQVSTTDKNRILEIACNEAVDYIIAYASDPAAPTAAYVAEKMNLPTNPYKSVETLCNKDRYRSFLASNGFSTPRASSFTDIEEAKRGLAEYVFPVILKPVDSSGSKGVTVLFEGEKAEEAIEKAFSFSRNHRIIIEEYVEKKHPYLIGGDIFVLDGEIVLWGLMNCHRDSRANPLVPAGKSYPLILADMDLQLVKETLQRLITKLEIRFGSLNVEVIIDAKNRVIPIDIGPRCGGNMIPDLLGYIFGCDMVEMNILAAMGQTIKVPDSKGTGFYASINLHSNRDGVLKYIGFSESIDKYIIQKCIYKSEGDKVRFFNNAADALGVVFFELPNEKVMIDIEEKTNEYIEIALSDKE